jgi:hypothetical protein
MLIVTDKPVLAEAIKLALAHGAFLVGSRDVEVDDGDVHLQCGDRLDGLVAGSRDLR